MRARRADGTVTLPAMRSTLYRIGAFKAAYVLTQLLPRSTVRHLADALAFCALRCSPELRRTLA